MEGQQAAYEKKMQEEAQKQQMEEQRQSILIQILTPEAKERLMKIKMVKPEKAMGIENSIIKAAQSGMLKARLSEKELVALLQRESENRGEQKITVLSEQRSSSDEESTISGDLHSRQIYQLAYSNPDSYYLLFKLNMHSRYTQTQLSSNRKTRYMRDIRNTHKQSILKRARSQIVNRFDKQQLSSLIEETMHRINLQQLEWLVKYANQQEPLAIGHLGNLILDEVVEVTQLERFQLKPGYHPRWLWLIEVMVEKQYCTLALLDHCIKTISPQRSKQAVKSALSVLFKISSSNLHSPMLLCSEQTLIAILKACMRPDQASESAYLLVYQLVMLGQKHLGQRLQQGVLRQLMLKVLIYGSMSLSEKLKFFTCNIIAELLTKDIYFTELNQTLIIILKQSILNNFEDTALNMLLSFVIKVEVENIIQVIGLGLIEELGTMQKKFKIDEDHENQSKMISLGRQLNEKVKGMGLYSQRVYRELKKKQMLSFGYQIQYC